MAERIVAEVVEEGDGCFTLRVESPGDVDRLKDILGSPCGVRVVADITSEVDTDDEDTMEVAEVVEPAEVVDTDEESAMAEMVCPLEPEIPWQESVCGELEQRLTVRLEDRVEQMARVLLGEALGQGGE